jgi:hypothetical protein
MISDPHAIPADQRQPAPAKLHTATCGNCLERIGPSADLKAAYETHERTCRRRDHRVTR